MRRRDSEMRESKRTYRISVLRRRYGEEKPFWQSFDLESAGAADTVASALLRLNEREELFDTEGRKASPIRWECSCLQKKCGACAMVINGRPRLACDAFLREFRPGRPIRLEPLKKFPVVADLIVDRSILFQNLREMKLWIPEASGAQSVSSGKRGSDAGRADNAEAAYSGPPTGAKGDLAYEASRCLQCGICLELCPNFAPEEAFFGMAAAVPVSRLLAELSADARKVLSEQWQKRVYDGCGKSLACQDACPAKIPIDELMSRSNGAAVWRRRR